jgi:REP element-mobilizing transposase RayT
MNTLISALKGRHKKFVYLYYKNTKINIMAQSLTKLYVHIIFHTKNSNDIIKADIEQELHSYIGSLIKKNDSIPIEINNVPDHIHILCIMSKNISLAKLVEEIKKNSSRWIKTKGEQYKKFAWQGGYGGFSVSPSIVEKTKVYIKNQKQHHKKVTAREEYEKLLKVHGVDFNRDYLWT